MTTGVAIQSPFTLYYVTNNDWSSSHSYQFWNKNFTGAVGMNNDATLKTIYSPSPSGFVEPKTAAFTGFTSTGGNTTNGGQFNVSGSFNKGWNLYTNGWKTGNIIFFRTLGFRDIYSSSANTWNVGKDGLYWTVGAANMASGKVFYLCIGGIYTDLEFHRAYGLNCCSVKE